MSLDADDLLGRMTLEEKVGQLFFLAFAGDRLDEAQVLFERHFVGGSYLSNDNLPNARAAAELTRTVQGYARNTRLEIPLLLGADQEGAWSVMSDSAPGPGNMALGATGDPACARRMFQVIGEELAAVGVDVVLAPVADCNTSPRNASIGVRSFGERPALVGEMTAAAVEGVLAGGALPTIKHYPGHGDTTIDSHRGLPTVARSRDELFAIDLAPFARGVAAGAPIVMTAHIVFPALDPGRPATMSRVILEDVLRGELGFEGVVLSDSMNMQSMRRNYDPADSVVEAIAAGVDLVMLAEEHYDHDAARYLQGQVALVRAVIDAVRDGRLSEARVDEAVGRVLVLKQRIDPDRPLSPGSVGSAEHRAVESAAAEAAVALLRAQHGLVPVAPGTPVTVVNTTLRDAYEPLGHTRGIGPNQTDAAFNLFIAAVRSRLLDVTVLNAEEVLQGARAQPGTAVVAVTESHLLPGMDFDQRAKLPVLEALAAHAAGRMLVVGLRDPYELGELPFVGDYLCAFSSRPCAAEAAARVLVGEVAARGASPVGMPGAGIEAPVTVSIDRFPDGVGGRIAHLIGGSLPTVAPAATLSVWHQGELVYEAAFGQADGDGSSRQLTVDALFDLASLTKPFTATAFLRHVSEGTIGLDDALVQVVPEFGVRMPRPVDGGQEPLTRRMLPTPPKRAGWTVDPSEVTFRQLLAHTSGLAPWRSVFEVAGPVPPPPTEQDPVTAYDRSRRGLEAVYGYPFVDRPGRSIRYSDLGFMLLGQAVERLSGTPLATVIGDRVTGPLGLDSVTFAPLRSDVSRTDVVPTSVDELWRMRRCWGEVEDENCAGLGGIAGHAGLFATAHDVARFGQAWLEGDAALGIPHDVRRETISEQAADPEQCRGLGWQLRSGDEDELFGGLAAGSFGHTGFTGTSLVIDPTRALVVALLTNRVYAGRTHAGIESLRRHLHGLLAEAL